ncbi:MULTISPECIES: KamA family radical SAM protein [unclassified Pseudomonas]|uniref:KamA family radical SAM protein n=1 Tax=unclassified Pseudomonas TaxID=196821 RepID=UPI0011A7090A|nr:MULTISPECIES: KamA family radical SAM protein [unclassified Pseudomonas]MEB0047065.1 KamA family radical SAM protein [Pseudomonas sp. Dout3]MEB0098464.1 KamA family radical SAM protein [Pseudomonas sp. DC1.2]TWC73843.1 L-lysine 2,3-aminomutase [Pseudomonas sp. SJZ103]TWC83296.1 L-lysine 2,3-aminomutase [Pseudomonas sp. SJZ094]WPX58939.1 KamA family radical SAM protein [Pseudomonas sp. DC1.2]
MTTINQVIHVENQWSDWRWQQKNAVRDERSLREACGGWGDDVTAHIVHNLQGRKLQITPYYIDLIMRSRNAGSVLEHPLWRQVVPYWNELAQDDYDGISENWELHHEMKTPICQHKYDNRVILRMTNTCNAYCQFCFEALRTLQVGTEKPNANTNSFLDSLEYIRNTPAIEEVILSGGDPLMLSDRKLEENLAALRSISDDLLIRIHSRALSFNPFRVTDELVAMLEKYKVNAFGLHVCHPLELSDDFARAVKRIQSVVPIVFSNMPLLRGVNDDEQTLHTLFIDLYRMGVKPYYLYHFMPFSPGASEYKASISHAIALMKCLKRRVSNIAMPEYVLPHAQGKFTVPIMDFDKPDELPRFEMRDGQRYYTFQSWNGHRCSWHDA